MCLRRGELWESMDVVSCRGKGVVIVGYEVAGEMQALSGHSASEVHNSGASQMTRPTLKLQQDKGKLGCVCLLYLCVHMCAHQVCSMCVVCVCICVWYVCVCLKARSQCQVSSVYLHLDFQGRSLTEPGAPCLARLAYQISPVSSCLYLQCPPCWCVCLFV